LTRPRKAGWGVLLVFGIFITILGVYDCSEEWKYNGFDSMEPTPVSGVEMGKLVKIMGKVESSPQGSPVIQKVTTIRSGKSGTSTHYEHVDHFTVSDSSGPITVTLNTESVVRYRGDRYDVGDGIVIVGVVRDWGGEKSISVQGVATASDGFGEKGAMRYFGEGVLTIGIIMIAVPAALMLWKRRKGGPETSATMAPVTPQPQFGVPGVVNERYGR
jgi:hypothetical protein